MDPIWLGMFLLLRLQRARVWVSLNVPPLQMVNKVNSLLSEISFINLKTTQPAGVQVQDKTNPSLLFSSVGSSYHSDVWNMWTGGDPLKDVHTNSNYVFSFKLRHTQTKRLPCAAVCDSGGLSQIILFNSVHVICFTFVLPPHPPIWVVAITLPAGFVFE